MTIPSDYLVERRALTRKLSLWRILAIAGVIIGLLAAGARLSGWRGPGLGPHIARVSIQGMIVGDKPTLDLLKDVRNSSASAVILAVDSPGGTTTGSEKLYQELRRLSEKKPIAVVVGNVAASGAYIAALGGDQIFASGNSLVGSIGVLFQIPNVSQLLDKVGVKMETVKSSPLKAAPDGFSPTSEEAKKALDSLVKDSYAWFKGLVQERRGMNDEQLAIVSDGRVFTGRQGLPLKLIDAIGGEREAVAWLENERKIPKKLSIRDWKARRGVENLGLLGQAGRIAGWLGWTRLEAQLSHADSQWEAHNLDGLLAIWQIQTDQ
jgi:protease-4